MESRLDSARRFTVPLLPSIPEDQVPGRRVYVKQVLAGRLRKSEGALWRGGEVGGRVDEHKSVTLYERLRGTASVAVLLNFLLGYDRLALPQSQREMKVLLRMGQCFTTSYG